MGVTTSLLDPDTGSLPTYVKFEVDCRISCSFVSLLCIISLPVLPSQTDSFGFLFVFMMSEMFHF